MSQLPLRSLMNAIRPGSPGKLARADAAMTATAILSSKLAWKSVRGEKNKRRMSCSFSLTQESSNRAGKRLCHHLRRWASCGSVVGIGRRSSLSLRVDAQESTRHSRSGGVDSQPERAEVDGERGRVLGTRRRPGGEGGATLRGRQREAADYHVARGVDSHKLKPRRVKDRSNRSESDAYVDRATADVDSRYPPRRAVDSADAPVLALPARVRLVVAARDPNGRGADVDAAARAVRHVNAAHDRICRDVDLGRVRRPRPGHPDSGAVGRRVVDPAERWPAPGDRCYDLVRARVDADERPAVVVADPDGARGHDRGNGPFVRGRPRRDLDEGVRLRVDAEEAVVKGRAARNPHRALTDDRCATEHA